MRCCIGACVLVLVAAGAWGTAPPVKWRNAQDQLPGRLKPQNAWESLNDGPVNCIRWFGPAFPSIRLPTIFLLLELEWDVGVGVALRLDDALSAVEAALAESERTRLASGPRGPTVDNDLTLDRCVGLAV